MSADNNYTELFERYLQYRLNERETKEFEVRLKIDPDFAKAFDLHKEIDKALLEDEIMFFRAELERIHEESKDKQWEAPMMLSREEAEELDEAILDQDVLSLRDKLSKIHNEIEAELDQEIVPKYSGIEKAVANQDGLLLHDELGKYEATSDFVEELTDEEVLDEEIDKAIAQADVMELRQKLDRISKEMAPETKVVPMITKVKRVVAVAAVILLVASSGLIINNLTDTDRFVDHEFEKFIMEMADPGMARGGADDLVDSRMAVTKGFQKFNEGDYINAIDFYKVAEPQAEDKIDVWSKIGQSYYMLEQYEDAIPYFQKVIQDNDNALLEKSEIMMMHCLWKLDRKDEVIERLQAILSQEDNHDFKTKTREILDRLN